MRRENEKLIIDGNAIYELDLECVRKKQGKQEGNGRCVEQSEERRQYACLKLYDEPVRAWLKKKQGNVRMLLKYA